MITPMTPEEIDKFNRQLEITQMAWYNANLEINELKDDIRDLKESQSVLVNEVDQLILHAEEGRLDYSVLEHARKLVFKINHPYESSDI